MKFGITQNPSDVLEELKLRLRTLRKQAGLSQNELAERSGVSFGSVKRFERTGQISLQSLLKLVQILNRLDDFESVLKANENLDEVEKLFSDKTRK